MLCDPRTHYDLLIDEGNDPVLDPPALRAHMDHWDGDAFFDLLSLNNAQSVLEIGVGTGRLALRAAPLCAHFTGIDFSLKTIERAQQHLSGCKNVTLLQGDFMDYVFPSPFDVVYSSLTFMHFSDKQRTIDKVFSLLSPNGRFVLSIDQNSADCIDMGTRRVPIYPDDPLVIEHCLSRAGFVLQTQAQTPFAHLFCAIHP